MPIRSVAPQPAPGSGQAGHRRAVPGWPAEGNEYGARDALPPDLLPTSCEICIGNGRFCTSPVTPFGDR